jgi:hypothetical protein
MHKALGASLRTSIGSPARVVFRILFPSVLVGALLIIPMVSPTAVRRQSIVDWAVRLVLVVFFTAAYWRVPDIISRTGDYLKDPVHSLARFCGLRLARAWLIFTALGFPLGIFVLTNYAVRALLPQLAAFASLIAAANSLIFAATLFSAIRPPPQP